MVSKLFCCCAVLPLFISSYLFLIQFLHTEPFEWPYRDIVFSKEGKRISFSEYGQKSSSHIWVHFHGTPGSSIFIPSSVRSAFENSGVRLILPDRSGFGMSAFNKNRTILDSGKDLYSLLSSLNLPSNCDLVLSGHSSGAPFAFGASIWGEMPCKLTSIILFAPAITHLSQDLPKNFSAQEIYSDIEPSNPHHVKYLVENMWILKYVFRLLAPMFVFYPESLINDYNEIHYQFSGIINDRTDFRNLYRGAIVDSLTSGVDSLWHDGFLLTQKWPFDLKTQLPKVPIKIYVGAQDTNTGVKMAQYTQTLIPTSTLEVVQDHTHDSLLFSKLIEIIKDFKFNRYSKQHFEIFDF
ncbi:hypothetical protein M0813_17573 [Anaeramoeba flamelloides]|uniref:AB hydrolase-1 domain-containing protein n=1 Tax=Anaeramoeba flamelloides TaxID=1746091 RepID=A0AAV7YXZ6_9EUKA|nr:hypothetical protein M0812_22681 [Anaeramoeba flamelloides]KAJ6248604.1 hypothetical protein M0813_17573 [Anaeramoeba flamelloides]